jgi:acetyltransferase-like isoleucine patch superfamily enzyme
MIGSTPEVSSTPMVHARTAHWHIRLAVVRFLMGIFPSFTLNRTRILALKACGLRVGRGTLFWGLPTFTGTGSLASQLRIGNYCGFNEGCEFEIEAPITIGDNVSVGHEVRFLTGSRQQGVETAAPITVGDGVWLGARCTIQAGVTVGAGTVIGAGMTVATDVPPNTLMTGAKPISLAKWR